MTNFLRQVAVLVLLAGTALAVRAAHAQCEVPASVGPDTVWRALSATDVRDCHSAAAHADAKRLGLDPTPGETDPATLKATRRAILATWRQVIDELGEQLAGASGELATALSLVLQRAEAAQLTVERGPEAGHGHEVALREAWVMQWRAGQLPPVFTDAATPALKAITLRHALQEACRAEGPQCPQTYARGERLFQLISLAEVAGDHAGAEGIRQVTQRIAAYNDEWDRFLLEGKPMYPLDLVLTDVLSGFRGEQVEGFRRPPRYQWFLLHPAPALEYVSEAPDGEQLEPSVYVELIGLNAWRSSGFSGLSLIATYADRAAADDLRYGVLITWNSRFSLAATFGDGDTGFLVSLDLAAAYRDKLKPALEQLK